MKPKYLLLSGVAIFALGIGIGLMLQKNALPILPPPAHLDGVKVTDVLIGDGEQVTNESQVKFHYRGYLVDFAAPAFKGRAFDSSYDREKPMIGTIGTKGMLPGLEQGLMGMKPGGDRIVLVPASLGYGDQGAEGLVPPKSDLYFEIHLLSVGP